MNVKKKPYAPPKLREIPKSQVLGMFPEHGTITIRVRVGMPLRDAQHFARECYMSMLKSVREDSLRSGRPFMDATWHPDHEHKVDLLG